MSDVDKPKEIAEKISNHVTDQISGEKTDPIPVMIIGAGVTGIQSSLDLAHAGVPVWLVERKPSIGGVMAALDKTFPTLDCSICIEAPLMSDVMNNANIT